MERALELVRPFVIFKREQVDRGLALLARLERMRTPEEFLEIAQLVDAFATLNYSKRKTIDAMCVQTYLSGKGLLVPVTTEALPQSAEIACDYRTNGKSRAAITRQLLERG